MRKIIRLRLGVAITMLMVCGFGASCSTRESKNSTSETGSVAQQTNKASTEQAKADNSSKEKTEGIRESPSDLYYKLPRLEGDEKFFDVVGSRFAATAGMKFHLATTEQKFSMEGGTIKIIRNNAPQAYIDPMKKGFNFAGLTFPTLCDLEIFDDGTLLTNRAGILTKDKDGKDWESREVVLNNKKLVAFVPK